MCSLLLHQLGHQLTSSSEESFSAIRVYARAPASLGSERATLVRVASLSAEAENAQGGWVLYYSGVQLMQEDPRCWDGFCWGIRIPTRGHARGRFRARKCSLAPLLQLWGAFLCTYSNARAVWKLKRLSMRLALGIGIVPY